MAQNVPFLLRLMGSTITAANRAGKIIRDVMTTGDLGIVGKGVNDIQTEADRSAQRCIVGSLLRQYPKLSIIGEEGKLSSNACEMPSDWIVSSLDLDQLKLECPDRFLNVNDEDVVVWVDPLDGTNEYSKGLVEHVTVLIGVAIQGEAVGGVIHQPYFKCPDNTLGRTFWGLKGSGVVGIQLKSPAENQLIVTTSRSHANQVNTQAVQALKPDEILPVGGSGHKIILLIEGKAHVYLYASKGLKKWDTCAPEAILHAFGGRLTDINGVEYKYHKDVQHLNATGILATAPSVDHSKYLRMIPDSVKEVV